jgi:hypothetical protein
VWLDWRRSTYSSTGMLRGCGARGGIQRDGQELTAWALPPSVHPRFRRPNTLPYGTGTVSYCSHAAWGQ